VLTRVEWLSGQRPEHVELLAERLTDGLLPAADRAPQIGDAGCRDPLVELRQRADLRDRHQIRAAEPADVALDAALLVRAFLARTGEARFIEIVRAQRDEPVGLHAAAAAQHPLDRRAKVVVPDQAEHATEELQRGDVTLQKRLLGLAPECLAQGCRAPMSP
jgi:hypothetical protein